MLIIYGRVGRGALVEELAETTQCLERDARLRNKDRSRAGHGFKHPGGDFESPCVVEVQPAVEDDLPETQSLTQDVDIPAEPGMERIPDRTDIDQSGLVLRRSRFCLVNYWEGWKKEAKRNGPTSQGGQACAHVPALPTHR